MFCEITVTAFVQMKEFHVNSQTQNHGCSMLDPISINQRARTAVRKRRSGSAIKHEWTHKEVDNEMTSEKGEDDPCDKQDDNKDKYPNDGNNKDGEDIA